MRYLISIFFGLLLALGSPTVSQAAVISGGQEFGPTNVTANNTDFFTLDTVKYTSVIVQVTSVGGGATISWQGSNDSTFATTVALMGSPSAGGAAVTSTTSIGHWVIAPTTRYIRVRTTAYTSGTITVRATATEKEASIATVSISGGSLSANQSTNVAQVAGTTVDTNSGNKSAGTQRVILATDQPNFTTPINGNIAQINGVTPLMGNGVTGTGSHRVTIASDNTAFTVNLGTGGTGATSIGKARDSAIGATDTGIAILGVRRDTPTAETPAAGDYVVPQISSLGETWIKDIGAGTTHHLISAATTNATSVKASAGTVNQIIVNNTNAAVRYLKLYNKASAPTVGTDTPVLTLAIPAGSVQHVTLGSRGLRLGTGIAYALTTGIAVADTGAVAASEHAVHISYE